MIEGTGSHISHRHQKMSKQCRITSSDYKKGIRDDNFSTCLLKKKSFDHGLIYFLKLLWNINPPIDNFPVQCQPRQIQKTFRIFSYPAQLFVDYAMVYAYMGQHYTQVPNNNFLVQYWYSRSRQHGIYSQLQGSCKKRLCGLLGQHYCMHTSIYLIFCAILSDIFRQHRLDRRSSNVVSQHDPSLLLQAQVIFFHMHNKSCVIVQIQPTFHGQFTFCYGLLKTGFWKCPTKNVQIWPTLCDKSFGAAFCTRRL